MARGSPYLAISVVTHRASGWRIDYRPDAGQKRREPANLTNLPFKLFSDEARFGDKL
jgi:hypothetical protein